MAIRNLTIPLLSGGALLFGFAAFSWLRTKRALRAPSPERDSVRANVEPLTTAPAPLAEPSQRDEEIFDLDLSFVEELPPEPASSFEDPLDPDEVGVAPEDLGALFLARATDALSPFGDQFGHRKFDLDQLGMELGALSEATARAANGDTLDSRESDDEIAESERRPKEQRVGARR